MNNNSLSKQQALGRAVRWQHWVAGIVIITGGITLSLPHWTQAEAQSETTAAKSKTRRLPVQTTKLISVDQYSVQRTYTGEVKANRASELGFEQGGKLVWLGVKAGDRVSTGSPIARLDTQNLQAQKTLLLAQKQQAQAVLQELQNGPRRETIANAKSQVADLQDRLALEQIKRSRREYLYQQGAISKEQLDEISFGQNALQDRIAGAQSQVTELETGTRPEKIAAQTAVIQQINAQIADLNITINKSTLTAPFSGIISQRQLDEGTVVNRGQSIVRLVEGASPEVEIGLPNSAIKNIQLGGQYPLKIANASYAARLTAIKPEINTATRTQTVVLKLAPTTRTQVAPKQIAQLSIKQTVPTQGFWLPTAALIKGSRGLWACYAVIETDNGPKVERRDIEVLYTAGDRALIRGMVQADDTIVTRGVQRLVNGQPVQLAANIQP
ncbi:efflux RND transporter periplasmic adaptor subunit [filamentous cyanobacterium LEGE 11480]|uniref:Efflux RND transporter periplasmic adaptor subunit n=1 Tax=Romeriopsis navalis LEGE 11480 TaxID=2777977 RepID=A0A928VHV7_9CYAN|nr:efflux RND transporter periplasmic adaptor subunit [Romeriopsis navalis]MBE9028635.1 efflux RND transporter periplasmic adaptor subunit [Romeriopsis navalis LEGE 11480]